MENEEDDVSIHLFSYEHPYSLHTYKSDFPNDFSNFVQDSYENEFSAPYLQHRWYPNQYESQNIDRYRNKSSELFELFPPVPFLNSPFDTSIGLFPSPVTCTSLDRHFFGLSSPFSSHNLSYNGHSHQYPADTTDKFGIPCPFSQHRNTIPYISNDEIQVRPMLSSTRSSVSDNSFNISLERSISNSHLDKVEYSNTHVITPSTSIDPSHELRTGEPSCLHNSLSTQEPNLSDVYSTGSSLYTPESNLKSTDSISSSFPTHKQSNDLYQEQDINFSAFLETGDYEEKRSYPLVYPENDFHIQFEEHLHSSSSQGHTRESLLSNLIPTSSLAHPIQNGPFDFLSESHFADNDSLSHHTDKSLSSLSLDSCASSTVSTKDENDHVPHKDFKIKFDSAYSGHYSGYSPDILKLNKNSHPQNFTSLKKVKTSSKSSYHRKTRKAKKKRSKLQRKAFSSRTYTRSSNASHRPLPTYINHTPVNLPSVNSDLVSLLPTNNIESTEPLNENTIMANESLNAHCTDTQDASLLTNIPKTDLPQATNITDTNLSHITNMPETDGTHTINMTDTGRSHTTNMMPEIYSSHTTNLPDTGPTNMPETDLSHTMHTSETELSHTSNTPDTESSHTTDISETEQQSLNRSLQTFSDQHPRYSDQLRDVSKKTENDHAHNTMTNHPTSSSHSNNNPSVSNTLSLHDETPNPPILSDLSESTCSSYNTLPFSFNSRESSFNPLTSASQSFKSLSDSFKSLSTFLGLSFSSSPPILLSDSSHTLETTNTTTDTDHLQKSSDQNNMDASLSASIQPKSCSTNCLSNLATNTMPPSLTLTSADLERDIHLNTNTPSHTDANLTNNSSSHLHDNLQVTSPSHKKHTQLDIYPTTLQEKNEEIILSPHQDSNNKIINPSLQQDTNSKQIVSSSQVDKNNILIRLSSQRDTYNNSVSPSPDTDKSIKIISQEEDSNRKLISISSSKDKFMTMTLQDDDKVASNTSQNNEVVRIPSQEDKPIHMSLQEDANNCLSSLTPTTRNTKTDSMMKIYISNKRKKGKSRSIGRFPILVRSRISKFSVEDPIALTTSLLGDHNLAKHAENTRKFGNSTSLDNNTTTSSTQTNPTFDLVGKKEEFRRSSTRERIHKFHSSLSQQHTTSSSVSKSTHQSNLINQQDTKTLTTDLNPTHQNEIHKERKTDVFELPYKSSISHPESINKLISTPHTLKQTPPRSSSRLRFKTLKLQDITDCTPQSNTHILPSRSSTRLRNKSRQITLN